MIRLFISLLFFGFSSLLASQSLDLQDLGSALKNNYSFIERSLDPSQLTIEESSGTIVYNNSILTIEIIKPFKEKYILQGGVIEVHDLELEQVRTIETEAIQNNFISILSHGIEDESKAYTTTITDDRLIELQPSNGGASINFIFQSKVLKLIRYTDPMNIEHAIELLPL